jgi:hypothetical protein
MWTTYWQGWDCQAACHTTFRKWCPPSRMIYRNVTTWKHLERPRSIMFLRGGISVYHRHGGHHFLYRIESPTRLIHPYARHGFGSWFGQKTTHMNHAPFSMRHDVMTWLWRNRTVWRSAYGRCRHFAVHCHCCIQLHWIYERPDKLLERIIWNYFDSWIMRGSVATHKK